MEHLEAQSYIMPFIDGKVPDSKQSAFVIHMKNCKKCHEELEIYYTLMVGMRQLDNNMELSTDFSKDLERDLSRLNSKAKTKRRVKFSAFSLFLTAFIIVGAFVYAGIIAKIYGFEQSTKEANQGEYYFSTRLHDNLLIDDQDVVKRSEELKKQNKTTTFERIHGYKDMEEDLNQVLRVGEELLNVEASTD